MHLSSDKLQSLCHDGGYGSARLGQWGVPSEGFPRDRDCTFALGLKLVGDACLHPSTGVRKEISCRQWQFVTTSYLNQMFPYSLEVCLPGGHGRMGFTGVKVIRM